MGALVLTALMGLATLPVLQEPDGEQYTLAVDVDLVVFNVTVTDDDGLPARGLEAEDFRIFEEGGLQEVSLFRPENAVAAIGLIVDSSGSMRDKRTQVTEAALAFVDASNPEDDIFVVTFNENVFLHLRDSGVDFTSNRERVRAALLRTRAAGLTALYDASSSGLETLRAGRRDRNALVVLSDGGDNASRRTLDDLLDAARRSSATIYTIGIYDEYNRDRNPDVLRQIAGLTGGQAYFPSSPDELEQVWRDIALAIRAQYTLGYYTTNPSHDGAFRDVRIFAGRDGQAFRVQTREGYIAPADNN